MPSNSHSVASLLNDNMQFFSLASTVQDRHYFPSSIIALNGAIGDPRGIPGGTLLEIIGEPKNGKSTVSLDFIANAQRSGVKDVMVPLDKKTTQLINAVYVDFERSFDPKYAAKIGVDLDKLLILKTDWGEQSFDAINALLLSGVQIIVIDSIPMFIPRSEEGKSIGDNEKMASAAGVLSKAIKRLIQLADQADALVILINQYRAEMSQLARRTKKPFGARIIQYAVKAIIELSRVQNVAERTTVNAIITKTKFGAEGQVVEFDLVFGQGLDKNLHTFTLGIDHDIIVQKGAWYSYTNVNGEVLTAQGKQNSIETFPMDEIRAAVVERELNNASR